MSVISRKMIIIFSSLLSAACRRTPDEIDIFKSNDGTFFYSSEYYYGSGPVNSDYTRIYYNFRVGDRIHKQLIASGDYLTVGKMLQLTNKRNILCKTGGRFDRYNRIILAKDEKGTREIITEIRTC